MFSIKFLILKIKELTVAKKIGASDHFVIETRQFFCLEDLLQNNFSPPTNFFMLILLLQFFLQFHTKVYIPEMHLDDIIITFIQSIEDIYKIYAVNTTYLGLHFCKIHLGVEWGGGIY